MSTGIGPLPGRWIKVAQICAALLAALVLTVTLPQPARALTTTFTTMSPIASNPSVYGQTITLTATVTGVGTTGTVSFYYDSQNLLGSVSLASGTANLFNVSLPVGLHLIYAVYSGDSNFIGSTSTPVLQTVNKADTSTTLSPPNPSSVMATVTANVPGSGIPTGTVTFLDGATNQIGTVTLDVNGSATLAIPTLTAGSHTITAVYNGSDNFKGSSSNQVTHVVSTTSTTLTSSLNPSRSGQPVTFTATVSGSGGTPTSTVTFKDGAALLGSSPLAGGVATFTTAALTVGSHSITASYGGSATLAASMSASVIQVVNIPADSMRLRAMQVLAAPVAAQASGQAIAGAVDAAITEGFSEGGGAFITPSSTGTRFNFAADPETRTDYASDGANPFAAADGGFASPARSLDGSLRGDATRSRVNDGFNAMAYATKAVPSTKAPPRIVAPPDWLGWAEVRGSVLGRWNDNSGLVLGAVPGAPLLFGNQVNALAGLTRKLTPNFLIGALGGYETFDYRSDALQGRLKGEGWTVGAYLGWRVSQNIRLDTAVAYSGIGYNGTAGLAAGSFSGNRWLATGGLTGTYRAYSFEIEPSARVYALWEHENAYTDTLGTLQTARDFSTGRASGGVKVAYPVRWSDTVLVAPYVGLYGDYYFNTDNAGAIVPGAIPTGPIMDGWSARATGGLAARFNGGAMVSAGADRAGIGGNFALWTYRVRASVPFAAQ